MGVEIAKTEFADEDFSYFKEKLTEETKILKNWFQDSSFVDQENVCGLELEAWLVDKDFIPLPENDKFLSSLNSDLATNELAKFNFELNAVPHRVRDDMLSKFQQDLSNSWQACIDCAGENDNRVLIVGSLPTLRPDMLSLEYISSMQRYTALNTQIMNLRDNKPIQIDIKGKDHLTMQLNDVMLESAATSLQIHLQVNTSNAVRFYNACHIASSFMVAIGANSPFLFGKELWEETRIPIFEQAVSVASFRDSQGDSIGRVTFGSGYAHNSLIEPFLENLNGYPVLLPAKCDNPPEKLSNLKLHNGCIWRWNRPLIGTEEGSKPHLRIEHRVVSSGPTVADIVANIAIFLGIVYHLSSQDEAPEENLSFATAKKNFYEAARYGLNAKVQWLDNKSYNIQSLLLDNIIPKAREALLAQNIDENDVSYYIGDIIHNRVLSGRNGAAWQKSFISTHGANFQLMTENYFNNQQSGMPVHQWKV